MSTELEVYLQSNKVGRLWLDKERHFVFTYDRNWLQNAAAVPLSIRLPLQKTPYEEAQARPFFTNLLPESDLRRNVARRLGLSEQNDFALLEAVGGECAGAVSLFPQGEPLSSFADYRPLAPGVLDDLIEELPRRPLLAGEEGIRLSLAGAQNKLPVLYRNDQLSLPLGTAPSSHILKPPIEHYANTVENEYYCMRLAERTGLAAPEVCLLHRRKPLYLIQRYDRVHGENGNIQRLHQEDFCQALGYLPEQKYEKEGGPGLQQCFVLLRERSVQPVADVRALLDWVIFCYLIGNADAHAKNISLLLTPQGPRLAPFYDLMCTALYDELTDRLAMRIGGEDRPDWIIARKWQAFADEAGIAWKLVRQRLLALQQVVAQAASQLRDEVAGQHGACPPVYDRIRDIIAQRAGKLTQALNAEASQT